MQFGLFQNFIDSVSTLTLEQYEILSKVLTNAQIGANEAEESPDSNVIDKKSSAKTSSGSSELEACILSQFAEHPVCPKCQGDDIGRWGFQCGRQRYRCNSCSATFNAFSCTPLARLRYPEKWNNYLTGMTCSMTLRASASEYGIALETAFRWRHRFLEVINNDQAEELCDITELDETFFENHLKVREKACQGRLANAEMIGIKREKYRF